ncbi:hypothetical protein CSIM01_00475 [Colletotrichum simmondsii]|uniref:Uncharacterized protein n=1 Tax=Colletotrichum simmondsii TaxID=703756 RepID=A0A135SIP6_9PEZI|nr:hypothetical protein CSIM01_00475 [Colletotrichum simmondsii]
MGLVIDCLVASNSLEMGSAVLAEGYVRTGDAYRVPEERVIRRRPPAPSSTLQSNGKGAIIHRLLLGKRPRRHLLPPTKVSGAADRRMVKHWHRVGVPHGREQVDVVLQQPEPEDADSGARAADGDPRGTVLRLQERLGQPRERRVIVHTAPDAMVVA